MSCELIQPGLLADTATSPTNLFTEEEEVRLVSLCYTAGCTVLDRAFSYNGVALFNPSVTQVCLSVHLEHSLHPSHPETFMKIYPCSMTHCRIRLDYE